MSQWFEFILLHVKNWIAPLADVRVDVSADTLTQTSHDRALP
jgi:hypothetical protein